MKKLYMIAFLSAMGITNVFAQTTPEEQALVKEWLKTNQDKVNPVTSKEIRQLSPAAKNLILQDKKTLVYESYITINDIKAFENKNGMQPSVLTKEERKMKEKEKVKQSSVDDLTKNKKLAEEWLALESDNVIVITRKDYDNLNPSERTDNMLIYSGEFVTLEDIRNFKANK